MVLDGDLLCCYSFYAVVKLGDSFNDKLLRLGKAALDPHRNHRQTTLRAVAAHISKALVVEVRAGFLALHLTEHALDHLGEVGVQLSGVVGTENHFEHRAVVRHSSELWTCP